MQQVWAVAKAGPAGSAKLPPRPARPPAPRRTLPPGPQVHQAVIASGARFSGPTIHFVDEEYDTGERL